MILKSSFSEVSEDSVSHWAVWVTWSGLGAACEDKAQQRRCPGGRLRSGLVGWCETS